MASFVKTIGTNWGAALRDKNFRLPLLTGAGVMVVLLLMLPPFYAHIEKREGVVLNDWLLSFIGPCNVSVPIFILLWVGALLCFFRALVTPRIFLNYLLGYACFIIVRSICLVLVPLNPPIGLIELKDPLTNVFYGGSFITKDLFFSGHTATMVIMVLSLEKKLDKLYCKGAAFCVATLLLVQHVHYTIDVVAAPFFALFCYHAAQKWLKAYGAVIAQGKLPLAFLRKASKNGISE
jgi:hypothetical protein